MQDLWAHRHECIRISYAQDTETVQSGIAIIGEEVARGRGNDVASTAYLHTGSDLVLARVRGIEPVEGVVEVEANLAEAGAAGDRREVAGEAACEKIMG